MGALLLYILKSTICLILFYLGFKALLSNDTFFRFNRWVLLVGIATCMLLPAIKIQTSEPLLIQQPIIHLEKMIAGEETVVTYLSDNNPEVDRTPVATPAKMIDWGQIIALLYWAGFIFCLLTTLLSFRKMFVLIRSGRKLQQGRYTLILVPSCVSPFSWGRYIILSEEDYEKYPDEILTHEMMHLKSHHSIDLLFMECILWLHWFNPAIWLLKRELKDIHEYQADKGVLTQGIDATKYQLLLVKKAVGSSLYTLANSFNHSKIKKRITMMLKGQSNNWARLKLLLLVPVGFIALSVFASSKQVEASAPPPVEMQTDEPLLPTEDKSINSQEETKDEYNVYLSFTKTNSKGKEEIDGISIYGVGEEKALDVAQKAIDKGRFSTATLVIICPHDERVPASYQEKMKALFVKNNIKCKIIPPKSNRDKDGNLIPPPPPPAPDVYVTFNYKNGKKEQGLIVYERYLKNTDEIDKRFNSIYNDDISSVTITVYKKAPDGMLDGVEKYLKDKIKYDVEYIVKRE